MSYRAIQDECYEANLQLPKLGLVDLTFGNVSVVDRASAVFGIKPSGVDYVKLKPEDIVLIDLEGKTGQRHAATFIRHTHSSPVIPSLFGHPFGCPYALAERCFLRASQKADPLLRNDSC